MKKFLKRTLQIFSSALLITNPVSAVYCAYLAFTYHWYLIFLSPLWVYLVITNYSYQYREENAIEDAKWKLFLKDYDYVGNDMQYMTEFYQHKVTGEVIEV